MGAATLTEKGQIVIPAKIRSKYGLTPGTRLEVVDDGAGIRLVVHRRVTKADPARGYGMIKVPSSGGRRRLADFDAASLLGRPKRGRS